MITRPIKEVVSELGENNFHRAEFRIIHYSRFGKSLSIFDLTNGLYQLETYDKQFAKFIFGTELKGGHNNKGILISFFYIS